MGGGHALGPLAPRAGRSPAAAREGQGARDGGGAMKEPQHFPWNVAGTVGAITLTRPERKHPPPFDSYAELRDHFRALAHESSVRAVLISGEGGNFCSGGDVHE